MSSIPSRARPVLAALAILAAGSAAESVAENWPGFRGPTRQGISTETNLPKSWSATENVAWKTAIPGEGWSSPIVWGDRVFVTATTDEGSACHVYGLDRRDGRILWDKVVARQEPTRKENKNSHASATPVTDGRLVYSVFSSGVIVAVDFDGETAWTNKTVRHFSKHGLGASPILHGDLLVMPFDGSSDGEDRQIGWKIPWENAIVLAVDKRTGVEVWRGVRGKSRIAHVTPHVLTVDGKPQLVSGAGDVVQGFDPTDGRRLWSVYSQGEGVTPSIVLGDGLVYSCSGFEKPTIRAIRPGGSGDVTATHVAWEQIRGVPSLSSPLYVKPHLYAITNDGVASCYDEKTGDVVWQNRVGGSHSASPLFADGRIWFLSEDGETTQIKPGAEFEVLAKNGVGEKCQASLAVSQGNVFLRTESNLFCIGPKP